MGEDTRQKLTSAFWASGILLNLIAAFGAPYPGVWVLAGVLALGIGAGLYWGRRP